MKFFKNISSSTSYFEEVIQCLLINFLVAVLQFKIAP